MLADPTETLVLGIRACSQGEWRDGLTHLSRLEHHQAQNGELPGLFYSYLGHAVARCEGRKQEGLAMCLHAVELQPFQPLNYLNLARSYLLVRNRREAVRTLRRGLALDPSHRGLLGFQRELGVRRRRPIRFLSRGNPLNRLLGRLRGGWRERRRALRRQKEEEAALSL
ncbi:MAG: hypothetical protein GY769_05015 [bacterium]|nr:hypothetical protein [bacterium]